MRKLLAAMFLMAVTLVVASTSFAANVSLTVASSNPSTGVAITVSPNDVNAMNNGTTQFTRSYPRNAVVTLTAPATSSAGSFLNWRKGTTTYATTATTSVTLTGATTMTAVYGAATKYTLTVASTNPASGVSVAVSPNDTAGLGTGSTQFTRSYNSGTVVTLTAPATLTGVVFQKWQKGTADYASTATATVTMTAATTMSAVYVAGSAHGGITGTFTTPAQVTAKCLECHASAGTAILNSLHGMMPTASPSVTNATGTSQKLGEINTFCSYPNPALAGSACLTCHPTLGKFENLTAADLDCLMCHNDAYKRKFTSETDPAKYYNVVDWQGTPRSYIPAAKDANGNFLIEFNWSAMPGLTALDLVRGAKKPTATTCLNCHAKAGGSDWAKRGDLGLNSANPTIAQDFHLASVASGGAGLSCTNCHVPSNHKIPGRGIDLRPSEGGAVKTCADCHATMASGGHAALGHRSEPDRHIKRVSCQSCHIANFGKGGATEMSRNWTMPTWVATLCNGQGAWAGEELKVSNVVPDQVFFNGTSYVYALGQQVDHLDPLTGALMLADANGGINDAVGVSKLVPIKRHQGTLPVMSSGTNTGKMIPYDVIWQFMTGKYEESAERGKTYAGFTGAHVWKTVEAEMAINHGVPNKENVAACANCHHGRNQFTTAFSTKLDKLGYALKDANKDGKVDAADETIICSQCHLKKAFKQDWEMQHAHTQKGSGIGCTFCHDIKRPERGLCEPCNPDGTENAACINEFVDTTYFNHCK